MTGDPFSGHRHSTGHVGFAHCTPVSGWRSPDRADFLTTAQGRRPRRRPTVRCALRPDHATKHIQGVPGGLGTPFDWAL